jgi:Spy/CpxP family protein refolding chaperone
MQKLFKSGLFLLAFAVALSLIVSVNGYAQPPAPGPGEVKKADGDKTPPLTPEQKELKKKLFSDYAAKVKPVKKDLMDQRFIYEALKNNSNASVADIKDVVAQMRKLRDQVDALEAEFKDAYAKSGLPPLRSFDKKGRHGGHGHGDDGGARYGGGHGGHGGPGGPGGPGGQGGPGGPGHGGRS